MANLIQREHIQTEGARSVLVDPEMARQWLAIRSEVAGTRQRPLRQRKVQEYATRMQEGAWRQNASLITREASGFILDAQHRLRAVIQSGLAQRFLVRENAPSEDFKVLDDVLHRSAGDQITCQGQTNGNKRAAIVRVLLGFQRFGVDDSFPNKGKILKGEVVERSLTIDCDSSIQLGSRFTTALGGGIGVPGAIHYLMAEVDERQASVFFENLISGDHTAANDPCWVCREAVQAVALGRRNVRQHSIEHVKAVYLIKGWNAFIEGRPLRVLAWKPNDECPEISLGAG